MIGRAQRVWREVDVAACAAGGVPVLRRASGGGTVYHDRGTLNITLVTPGLAPGLATDLAAVVADVLRRMGLTPSATEHGVFAGSAKVSGLASQLTQAATLAHATLLVTTPAARVGAFLTPAPPDTHPLDSRRSPVAPLCELAEGLSVPAVRALVLREAADRYGTLAPRQASAAETCWQERLLAQRYRTDSWDLAGRAPAGGTKEALWTTKPP